MRMTTKEWLSRAYKLDWEINTLLSEKKRAFERASSVTSNNIADKVKTSSTNSSEDKFISYAAYDDLINIRIDELYKVKTEIINAINTVEDNTLRLLLIERYIRFKKWEQVAIDLNYDFFHVFKILHKKALEKINIPTKTN